MDYAWMPGPLLCVLSGLGHWFLSWVTYRQLITSFSSVTEKDLLYAANWAVSFLQASVVTIIGVVGCLYTGFDTSAKDLPVLVPYGWFNLGYWLYDLLALFHLANLDNTIFEKGKDSNWNNADWEKDADSDPLSCAQRREATVPAVPSRVQKALSKLARSVAVFVAWWPGIVAHHLGIILFMAVGVLSPTRAGQGDGLIIIGLLTELSSIFVAARGFLARVGLRESKWYVGVSIAMVVSFFVARILLVPLVIVLYSRQIGIPTLQGFRSIPLKCQMGTTAFYMLNSYWFLLMLRGCIKAIRKSKID